MLNRFCPSVPYGLVALVAVLMIGMVSIRAASIEVTVEHSLNGNSLSLEQGRYRNGFGEYYTVSRLSYLLSGFALQTQDGQWVALPDQIAWIDEARNRKNFVLNGVPEGSWRALRFYVGPGERLNHEDVTQLPADHPLNPELNKLYHSRTRGYFFLMIEGRWVMAGRKPSGYSFQLIEDPMRTRVNLPLALDTGAAVGTAKVRLRFDIGALFNAPVPISFERNAEAGYLQTESVVSSSLRVNLAVAFQANTIILEQGSASDVAQVRLVDMPASPTEYDLQVNNNLPLPQLPQDNPLLVQRVELGAKLFFDSRLSGDGSRACGTCHDPDKGYADPRGLSRSLSTTTGNRQAMPLTNLAWKREFGWDGRSMSIREEILRQLGSPLQMGQTQEELARRLSADRTYVWLFKRAFGSGKITTENVALALENYLLSLTTKSSRLDQAMRGQTKLTAQEAHGFVLFMTEYDPRNGQRGGDCFHCHGGPLFSDFEYHDIGLRTLVETVSDRGRASVTSRDEDAYKFATPSLRNISQTAPYMHDGRFRTLEEVVAHYDHGVEARPTVDPNLAKHPVAGLNFSAEEKAALVAFLKTL